MTTETRDKLWQNIDKLILTFLFIVCLGCAVWMMVRGGTPNEGSIDWAREITTNILSGLLGAMGGRAMQSLTTGPTQPHTTTLGKLTDNDDGASITTVTKPE